MKLSAHGHDIPGSNARLTRRQALGLLGALMLPWDRLRAAVGSKVGSRAAAAVAIPPPMVGPPPPDLPNFHGMMEWIAREPDAAALHAPGALLVQQCRQDELYLMTGMQGAVDKLTRIYAKAGLPERFRGTFYDEPHSFRPAMQEETFDWLDRWL